jgi:aryl-alcohol dehydrogenase-like predicted oxidoreductase
MLDAYLDMGGNFLDTARVYSDWAPGEAGRSERVLGDWLASRGNRSRVVLATKGAHPGLGSMHTPRMSLPEVEGDLHLSLKALRVDFIDLYYLHRDDRNRPVEEILSMLESFSAAGKIRRYACSNWRAGRMLEAYECSRRQGFRGFAANQVFWNMGSAHCAGLADDTCEAFAGDMRRAFERTGMLAAAYTSQAGGFFSKLEKGTDVFGSMYDTPGNRRLYRKALEIASRTGMAMTEIVLGYILSQPIPSVAVVGCRNMDQLAETMAAACRSLPPECLQLLEEEMME